MRKKVILAIILVGIVFLCFNYEKRGYYIEQGYSFKEPKGWEKNYDLGTLAFFNEEDYIFFIRDELKGRSYNQYYDYVKTQIKESSSEMRVLEEKDEKSFHIIIVETKQENEVYIIKSAFKKGRNGVCFMISLKAPEKTFENVEPVFDSIYKSFKLR